MKRIVWAACFAVAAAMPLAAAAETAFTVRPVDVFAGPSGEFPPIAQLPPSYRVEIFGCLGDWSWCDVGFAGDRGWIYAADLVVPYQGSRVAIIEYGPRIHLHIVSFSLLAYWDAHYRSRPFYRERTVWVSRVHIDPSHGGRPPSGRVATAPTPQATPQNVPSTRSAQAPREKEGARPPERQAKPAEKARPAETARAPAEERRAHVAQQAQQPEQQHERKPQREAQPQHAQQPSRAEPTQQADRASEGGQHERAAAPQASRAPESAQHERAAEHEGGKAKEERQPTQ
jgi:uncharacterized protein YraI